MKRASERILSVETGIAAQVASEVQAAILVAETNRSLEAGSCFWGGDKAGCEIAFRCLKRFGEIAGALESRGWPADPIREHLAPSRKVFATSPFMRRCQEWPCDYAGDFETTEYLAAGVNDGLPGTLGWHIERFCSNLKWSSSTEINSIASRWKLPPYKQEPHRARAFARLRWRSGPAAGFAVPPRFWRRNCPERFRTSSLGVGGAAVATSYYTISSGARQCSSRGPAIGG
jgi:hypothetical protein